MDQSKLSLEYTAGLIDGEGCFNFARCRNQITPRILVTNTDIKVLKDLQTTYGGDVSITKVNKYPEWKPRGMWRLSNKRALNLATALWPHLRIKKAQADIFKWYALLPRVKPIKAAFVKTMHTLNQKGVALNEGKKYASK